MVGIETTSFIAMLGSAGLAVGLALQGSMSNFAGGVLLLVLKPFKVGDLIEAQGFVGSVKEIGVLNTILKTADNRTIILPNSPLAGSAIVNYSTESTRRIDLVFRIDYADSIRRARETIHRLIDKEDRILSKPAPVVVVSELGDSAVNLTLRIWCKSEDFGALQFDIREGVKDAFDREKITVPVPQRQVRILPGNEAAAG
jgi:small conductance mechanosensitive channel